MQQTTDLPIQLRPEDAREHAPSHEEESSSLVPVGQESSGQSRDEAQDIG